jgi:hypothetical protein
VERGDDPSSGHVRIYQTLDRLEKGVNFLLFGGDGTTAPVLRCFFEGAIGVRRQADRCTEARARWRRS